MEELTVVVFYMEETWGRAGKRTPWHSRTGVPWQYRTMPPWRYHAEWQENICKVYLPKLMQKKKEWTKEEFASYMEGLPIPGESTDVYYYYTKEATAFLHRQNDSLSAEGARFLLHHYGIKTEALLLLEDTAVRGEDWLYDYAGDTRYMGILTDRPGEQEDAADFLYEEYGIVLQVADRAGKWRIPGGTSCLFVAGEKWYGLRPADIGQKGTLLFMGAGESRAFGSRLPEERMISVERYLRERRML